ncbi:MAG: hypothetical protein F6K24_37150 [Okeania sp. SIO2D1]|nr:hypothetical protein [Okeania sp. SIO2D1]
MIPFFLTNHQKFSCIPDKEQNQTYQNQHKDTQYQILIVEGSEGNDVNQKIKTTVYTGTQEFLKEKLPGITEDIDHLPNEGVNMDEIMPWPTFKKANDSFINQYFTIRRLLQSRKLSQLISKTWQTEEDIQKFWQDKTILDGEDKSVQAVARNAIIFNENLQNNIITKLFLSANRLPDHQEWQNYHELSTFEQQTVITPYQENWRSICLNLLFCGQAYSLVDGSYRRVLNPILSTYEASCLYSFEVVWDKFLGTIEEIQKAGQDKPNPPYYRVSLPYPPRPNIEKEGEEKEGLLPTEEMITKWVNAEDLSPDDEKLPFANEKWNPQTGIEIKYVTPPYPYLPMSCAC